MAMSRKHYEAVAAVLRERLRRAEVTEARWDAADEIEAVAEDLADLFAADDPRFDRARFLAAVRGDG